MPTPRPTLHPAAPAVGVEIRGVDLARLGDEEFRLIEAAWYRHSVLLVRDQRLSDADLIRFSQRFGELDAEREMVVHCKSGMRSAKAIQFLQTKGFRKLKNLKGGILAWADRIDPSVPKY